MQIGFSAALIAGETIGNAMGLGFASMVDPSSNAQSPALGQLLSILGTFLFLAMNGHLMLASIVVDSYKSMPPGEAWLSARRNSRASLGFGGDLFAAGMVIALPVGFALVLVQLVMAMLARTAPQMNLFSVGLPAALLAGLVLLAIAAPGMADAISGAADARAGDLAQAGGRLGVVTSPFLNPSPSGEGQGWGLGVSRRAWAGGRDPTPTPPLKGRG